MIKSINYVIVFPANHMFARRYMWLLVWCLVFGVLSSASTSGQGLTDQQLINAINNGPPNNSGQLKNLLIDNTLLSDAVLVVMLNRDPQMSSGHIQSVLDANSQLSDVVLIAMLQMSPGLPNGNISNVLANESPLSSDVLEAAGALQPPLPNGLMNNIVAANPLSGSVTVVNVNCNGGSDGAVDLTMSGGIPPYSFLWSNGAATEDISGLTIGVFNVTIIDTYSGNFTTSATLTEPPALVLSSIQVDNICHGESNGSINLTVTGGVVPYTYLWSNGATVEDIADLFSGNYQVTVTDANACEQIGNAVINEPDAIQVNPVITDITCNGFADGTIDLSTTGVSSPFSFLWSNGTATEDVSNLQPGNYSVTITDIISCMTTKRFTLSEPAELDVSAVHGDESYMEFNDGFINLSIAGGTLPFTFSWSSGNTTQSISGLSPDNYNVTVSDANSCIDSLQVTIATLGLSQQLTFGNHGVFVKVDSSIFLNVYGNIINNDSGLFANAGKINLTGDFLSVGGNQVFIGTGGKLELIGTEDQSIKGDQTIIFNNLTISGGGIKNLLTDITVADILDLTNGELACINNTLNISNADLNAISRTTGFISSEQGGTLTRATNSTDTYLFPVGSTEGTSRYRPVEIVPASPTVATYSVRFVNHDPTLDALSRSITELGLDHINGSYYYLIKTSASGDIRIFFDEKIIGSVDGVARWSSLQQWQKEISQVQHNTPPVLSFAEFTLGPSPVRPISIINTFLIINVIPSYAVPRRRLDGGYYLTINGVLWFKYEEEYNIDPAYDFLSYRLYDDEQLLVFGISEDGIDLTTGQPSPTPNVTYGDNRYNIDFTTLLNDNEFYNIEFINRKKERRFIRFQHQE